LIATSASLESILHDVVPIDVELLIGIVPSSKLITCRTASFVAAFSFVYEDGVRRVALAGLGRIFPASCKSMHKNTGVKELRFYNHCAFLVDIAPEVLSICALGQHKRDESNSN
jgi:hypothetical protein